MADYGIGTKGAIQTTTTTTTVNKSQNGAPAGPNPYGGSRMDESMAFPEFNHSSNQLGAASFFDQPDTRQNPMNKSSVGFNNPKGGQIIEEITTVTTTKNGAPKDSPQMDYLRPSQKGFDNPSKVDLSNQVSHELQPLLLPDPRFHLVDANSAHGTLSPEQAQKYQADFNKIKFSNTGVQGPPILLPAGTSSSTWNERSTVTNSNVNSKQK